MNNSEMIKKLEELYSTTIPQGRNESEGMEYYDENYYLLNKKGEIIELVLIQLNKPLDMKIISNSSC